MCYYGYINLRGEFMKKILITLIITLLGPSLYSEGGNAMAIVDYSKLLNPLKKSSIGVGAGLSAGMQKPVSTLETGTNAGALNTGVSAGVGTGIATGGGLQNPVVPGTGGSAQIGADLISTTPTAEPSVVPEIDYIAELKAAQLASRIAALNKSRDNALATLDAQEASVEPAYYKKRNQVQGDSDLGQMNFAQFMASRGIKGSAAAMPEIYRNNSLQTNLGNLNQQQQALYDTINNNRTGIQNSYEADVAAANAEVEAQALQAYIDQMNTEKQLALQTAGLTGTLNGAPTLAGQAAAENTANTTLQRQIDTISAYSADYQAEINRRQAINPNDPLIPYLQAARVQKLKDQETLAAKKAESEAAGLQAQWDNALEMWKQAGVAYPSIAAILGIPEGTRTAGYDIDSMKTNIAQQNANTAATNANKTKEQDITTNPDFVADYTAIMSNPDTAYDEVVGNAQALIDTYGIEGYNKLLSAAKSIRPY